MAYTSTALLALMVIAATSVVHCDPHVPDDKNAVVPVSIIGFVVCGVPGNTLTDKSTVKVSVSCIGIEGKTILGQAKPGPEGFFHIILSAADSATFYKSLCVVTAKFPVAKCKVVQLDGLVSSLLFPLQGNPGVYKSEMVGM